MFLVLMIFFFWLGQEITELTIPRIGSFKTNVRQASQYLDEIKRISEKLKAQDTTLTSSIEEVDKKISSTTANLRSANERASELEKTTSALRSDLENERTKTAARSWTKDQFDAIQDKGVVKDVGILWESHCIECYLFAQNIETALIAAGVQIYGGREFEFEGTGIIVWLPIGSDLAANPLIAALNKAKLGAAGAIHAGFLKMRTDIPVIFVGERYPSALTTYWPSGGFTAKILPIEKQ
jgi:vacuolar-type H+-ATPase subunit I/STV1